MTQSLKCPSCGATLNEIGIMASCSSNIDVEDDGTVTLEGPINVDEYNSYYCLACTSDLSNFLAEKGIIL